MPTLSTERAEPVSIQAQDMANAASQPAEPLGINARGGIGALIFVLTLSAFWIGAAGAYIWGYFGPQGLASLGPHLIAFAAVATFLPPFLFVAAVVALLRARTMGLAAQRLMLTSERLMSVDDTSIRSAQRVGRAVRRELDAMNVGLDGAFSRLRALETALEDRVAQLDEAGARAGVKAEVIARRMHEERERIEDLTNELSDAATRASETLAGRAAQLQGLIESAGGELKSAGQTLEVQSAQFREAAERAAQAPQTAAVELDRQAKRIETAADGAVARAEFVLARQERQRTAMNELLGKLKEESTTFETTLETQRSAIERATAALAAETHRIDEIADQGLRRIDAVMANAAPRTTQLATQFSKEADRVKETAETAATALARMVDTLREASASAQALVAESTADAKRRAKDFVGEAMGECDRLLRAAASVAEESEKARAALSRAAAEAEQQIVALPGVAAQEAERVREAMRSETEQILDISARTLATLQARAATRRPPMAIATAIATGTAAASAPTDYGAHIEENTEEEPPSEGLMGLARRITGGKRKNEERPKATFELSAVLAAADGNGDLRAPHANGSSLKPGAAAALSALEAALADLAVDLDPIMGESANPALWRRYLDGDRGIFARRLAQAIGPETVDRVAGLYRDNLQFRDAANAYLKEFDSLLAHARESDRDGLLASTILTADTGKVYLTVAYALGRLE